MVIFESVFIICFLIIHQITSNHHSCSCLNWGAQWQNFLF